MLNTTELKELIVVFVIAGVVFRLAKPVALQFSGDADFSRRRNVWLTLTAVGFLSPTFWPFVLVAAPLYWWASRKDTNPVAFYLLLLHVIPPIPVILPGLGNNGLFPMDNYTLLSFCVLAPAAWRLRKSRGEDADRRRWSAMDVLLLAFGGLVVALYTCPDLPNHAYIPDSSTNELRRAFIFFFDVYLLYWVVSRSCSNRRAITEALATFCLASVIMAATAAFEVARHWLLYIDMMNRWGDSSSAFYLTHGSVLRAEASSGHALSLGYLLAVAIAFWLYLGTKVTSRAIRVSVVLILCVGLYASYSRGPWLGAAACFFLFNAAGPQPLSRTARAVGIACLLAVCVAISPLGTSIYHAFHMPAANGNVDPDLLYRENLAQRGWQLVVMHPLFGDRFPWPAMADLRQGQGIIDLVDTYLEVALNYGLTGLTVFVGFILLAFGKAYRRARKLARLDPDLALLGGSLVAAIGGTLLMIANCSFEQGYAKMFYVLAGLAAAYSVVDKSAKRGETVRAHTGTALQDVGG